MRIGIDVGGTKIEAVALSNNGDELFRQRVPTPRDYQQTLATIARLVSDAETTLGEKGTVGAGIPGTVSPQTGLVKNANSTWLNGNPLDKDLSRLLNREVRVANDANCMTVSEATDGAGAGYRVVLALILGTGCGSGIAIGGKPHNGGNGIGGEWGHNPLPWQDDEEKETIANMPNCYCGKVGCIEQFVSGTGLCNDYWRRSDKKLTGAAIVKRSEQGDETAETTLQAYERRLAKSLAAYVNLLDPSVIVFAGGVCNIERLYENVPPLMNDYIFGNEFNTPIKKALHGDASGVRGAAWLWGKQ